MAGKAPVLKLEAFPLKAAVWENEHVSNGKAWKSHSVKLTKSFKDDKGQWKDTDFLSDRDLLAASALLLEVWRTITVKEGKVPASSGPADDPPGEHPF